MARKVTEATRGLEEELYCMSIIIGSPTSKLSSEPSSQHEHYEQLLITD